MNAQQNKQIALKHFAITVLTTCSVLFGIDRNPADLLRTQRVFDTWLQDHNVQKGLRATLETDEFSKQSREHLWAISFYKLIIIVIFDEYYSYYNLRRVGQRIFVFVLLKKKNLNNWRRPEKIYRFENRLSNGFLLTRVY